MTTARTTAHHARRALSLTAIDARLEGLLESRLEKGACPMPTSCSK